MSYPRRTIRHALCIRCGWVLYKIIGLPWLHAYSRGAQCYEGEVYTAKPINPRRNWFGDTVTDNTRTHREW